MRELGSDLFRQLNLAAWPEGKRPPRFGRGGVSIATIESAERDLGFSIPPDFRYFLLNLDDPDSVFFPWSDFSIQLYRQKINRVWEGIAFDIDDGFWMRRWGNRPASSADAITIAKADFALWPPLLPIFGHRFLPAAPCQPNNPVLSIMQTDIIFYGVNLAEYLIDEFVNPEPAFGVCWPGRHIDVWTDLVMGEGLEE